MYLQKTKYEKILFFTVSALMLKFATAATGGFSVVPTAWRLESYGANGVVLWYTPSTCGSGQMLLPNGATIVDHNRLYATVLAAKTAGSKVFINYNNDAGVCTIISFGIDPS